jgi:hypothetical protein
LWFFVHIINNPSGFAKPPLIIVFQRQQSCGYIANELFVFLLVPCLRSYNTWDKKLAQPLVQFVPTGNNFKDLFAIANTCHNLTYSTTKHYKVLERLSASHQLPLAQKIFTHKCLFQGSSLIHTFGIHDIGNHALI